MKKIFALALAAVMTAGMTTVAFAANEPAVYLIPGGANWMYVDADDNGQFGGSGDVKYLVDTGKSVAFGREDGGSKVAFPLWYADGSAVTEKDDVKGLKVKADWAVGDLDEKPEIELVKIEGTYRYAVTFTLPDSAELKASDLAGDLSVYRKTSDLKDTTIANFITLNIGAEYGYDDKELGAWSDLSDAEIVIFKNNGVKLEGEETLTFADYFEFEVDVTGQDKLNLKNNTKYNEEFGLMYDYANIDFITFEKAPRFNKIGTAYIYADEDAYIYEVTADGAKEIKGLEWDEDYEAWTFKTRTLGAYAISDVELDEKTVTEDKTDESSKTDDGVKENPDTGR